MQLSLSLYLTFWKDAVQQSRREVGELFLLVVLVKIIHKLIISQVALLEIISSWDAILCHLAKYLLVTSDFLKPTEIGIFFPSEKRRYRYKATGKQFQF